MLECKVPNAPLAWACLAGDAMDVLISSVAGIGEVIRGAKTVAIAAGAAEAAVGVAKGATKLSKKIDNLVDGAKGLGKRAGKKADTLYHYTNEKGINGIIDSKQLNPSLKANNLKDARYGNGQYLSDIKPNNQTSVSLAKKFINVPNKYKYTHFVEIDVTDLNVIQGRDGVFVIPNSTPLDLTNRIVSTGVVGK